MNYSKYRFNLDMQSYISQVSLPVRQHDTGIILRINLTDGGVPYVIRDGCRAVFYARKSDGNPLMNDCIIEKNTTICYELTQQTTACSGVVDCEVRLYGSDGNLITTPRFILVIDSRVVHDEDFPLSDAEQTVLDNIILSEQARIKAEEERVKSSAEALAKAVQAEELVDELIERLKVEDIGDEELRIHNENADAHKAMLGEGNEKGIRGYWIEAVNSYQLRLSTKTVRSEVGKPSIVTSDLGGTSNSETGYYIGDEFSIITPKDHYHRCGRITYIYNNLISYELYTTIDWNAGEPKDNNDYAFFVPAKADVGIVDVAKGGVATGYYTRAGGDYSFSEGVETEAIGSYSHAEGLETWAGYSAHAEGSKTRAVGKYAHTEGFNTEAKGGSTHAEGENTEAVGFTSHAEGRGTKAIGTRSHSEGDSTTASGDYSHAEGEGTVSSGGTSHAQGCNTEASGVFAHSEGFQTKAKAICAHAQGRSTEASGDYSFAGGLGTKATGEAQTALGKYNKENPDALLILGNGENDTDLSNAFEVISTRDENGNNHVSMKLGDNFEVKPDGTILTPYGSASLAVTGSYVGTGKVARTILTFDALPDLLLWHRPSDGVHHLLPKLITSGNGFEVSGNTITFTDDMNAVSTKYSYIALCFPNSTEADSSQTKTTSFTITYCIDVTTLEQLTKASYNVEEGTTWAEFIEQRTSSENCGVGASTGRVYWLGGAHQIEHGNGWATVYSSNYLTDSNGNYILGTDVIVAGDYVVPHIYNQAPPLD